MRIFFLLLVMCGGVVQADDQVRDYRDHPNYNSVGINAGVINFKDDNGVSDPNYIEFIGYSHLVEKYYMVVSAQHAFFDYTETSVTVNSASIGIGTFYRLNQSTDFIAEGAIVGSDPNIGDREWGAGAKLGVWTAFGPRLDLKATIGGVRIDSDTHTIGEFALYHHFTKALSGGVSGSISKDVQFVGVGFRYDVLF